MGLFDLKNPFKPTITPNQGYADIDPNTKQIIERDIERAKVTPEEIALQENTLANAGTSALVDPLASQQRQSALGGVSNDVANEALNRRAQKIYSDQLRKMDLAAKVGGYGKSSERQGTAFDRAARTNEVKMGMYARQAEYDQNRKAVRQSIVSSLVGQGMSIAGTLVGGMTGAGSAAPSAPKAAPSVAQSGFNFDSKNFGRMG